MSQSIRSLGVVQGLAHDDSDSNRRCAQEACRHARLAGDDGLLGQALGTLAAVSGEQRLAILRQAAELLTRVGNYRQLANAYTTAAYVAISEDRLREAADLLEVALDASARSNDPWLTMANHGNIGLVHLFIGEVRQAHAAFSRALAIALQHGFHYTVGEGLAGMAAVAAAERRYEVAAQLRGAAHACGYPLANFDKRIDDRLERDYLAPARRRYTAAAWDPAATAGSLLSIEHAIALAIGEPGSDSSGEGSNKSE